MAPDPMLYQHPLDAETLKALKGIPGFDAAVKWFMKNFNEKMQRITCLSSCIRITPTQLPELYNLLPPICQKLGIRQPEFFLELNRDPNAYTTGDTQTFLVITSGLLESVTQEELVAVLAHECGHNACHHVLYKSMCRILLGGSSVVLPIPPLVTTALSYALLHWDRCSEYSADRAAATYLGGPDQVVNTMKRLAGGTTNLNLYINEDEFLAQAEEFENYVQDNTWNRVLEVIAISSLSHPFEAQRAREIKLWCDTQHFRDLCDGKLFVQNGVIYINQNAALPAGNATSPQGQAAQHHCPHCGAALSDVSKFCRSCGGKLATCKSCGAPLKEGQAFCSHCGTAQN